MRKIIFTTLVAFIAFINTNAQETKFGAKVGYNSFIAKATVSGSSASSSASGVYAGFFADITALEKFHIQPELQIAIGFQDGETGEMLVVPIMGKYYVAENFNLQAGPQFDYILEESEGVKKLGFGLAAGAGYGINDNFNIELRYSFGLNNRFDDDVFVFAEDPIDPVFSGLDIKTKFNFFQIGIEYKF
ncbi:porin family protein [Seonamhaeicola maritimus]|uniref:porin family protein n=1 Tax=Seonamhaeicola maritimus TaxID=2591822 RepID=UPI002495354F|nr:porin family protein [Seonamhaeicola maritimus]